MALSHKKNGIDGFFWCLLDFYGFCWVLPGSRLFLICWVLLDLTRFNLLKSCVLGLPTSYKDYVAVNGAATSNRGAVPVPVAARSVTDAGVAATASDGGSGVGGAIDGRSTEEALACFWRITGATPGVDVDCAAYEASRLAVEAPSACGALNAAAVAALGLRRAGAGWNRPAFVNQRHQVR